MLFAWESSVERLVFGGNVTFEFGPNLILLQKMIGENVSKEKVESIAQRTMREADKDSDGSITFQEFCKVTR